MQLSKIKIAGFKSFVDPTTIQLPSNLVAVVGPNGCGKSNIIDAVTWVMGESSPKYLRGQVSTDVIFKGSSARKPVGQASVELVFDNSDSAIGGEYAKYNEISVKRVINRESDSTYMLNGVRCRKRDIVDIFLGTGLGPRSYSIIGQNMISRMIEAKPDELRTYLEEAAGISKYKERRHETELRIKHTKDNLDRVNDLRSELDKQLNHLRNQANVAEKFKVLKDEERTLRAQYYAIQWRELDGKMVNHTLQIQRDETAIEAKQSDITGAEKEIENIRHERRAAQDAFEEVQRRYYSVGNEITRIEQDITHHQERQQQWENDLEQATNDWQNAKDQISEVEGELAKAEQELNENEPILNERKQAEENAQTAVKAAEEAAQLAQTEWEDFNQESSKTAETVNVAKTRIQHLEQRVGELNSRSEQLKQDKEQIDFDEITREIEESNQKSNQAAEELASQDKQLVDVKENLSELRTSVKESNNDLDRVRSDLQRLLGQQASLEALQQTALGKRDNPSAAWADKHQLSNKPRLAQNIEVQNGWEDAVEKVLGFCLQAICVSNIDELLPHLDELKSSNLCIFNAGQSKAEPARNINAEPLITKIKSDLALDSLLSGIYVADTVEEGLKLCDSLNANESIVTKDGVWMNRAWLKILREDDPAAGVFQREQELKSLASRIDSLKSEQDELVTKIADLNEQIKSLENQRDELQASYNRRQAESAEISAQQKMMEQRLAELKTQSMRLDNDIEKCTNELDEARNNLQVARDELEQASNDMHNQTQSRESILQNRDHSREQLQIKRQEYSEAKDNVYQCNLSLQSARSNKESHSNTLSRLQEQLTNLNNRKISLQSELSSMPPIDAMKKSLERALDNHTSVEVELNTARASTESLDQEYRKLEEKKHTIESEMGRIRTSLEKLRLERQGWEVKAETITEQLKETEYTLEDVIKDLAENDTAEEWHEKVEKIGKRINRLGPINLMAIDEFASCQERKTYLDKQVEDLEAGLSTLEEAINKIDKETKSKFKETYDQVNTRFQELFPTIFGGGKAYLDLTSEDLLEAGVTMMACPPGKRNSSIHLLSGGEKSLTAIALIFSIFHLNPAPFCLLDEVDAALDDANVVRYTRLVKSMSDKTQFIFISHNKISIEMGEHLIGVTMNEPGVSRLVSVDIEKAMSLAGA